jgi:hypothetical protein
LKLFGTLRGIVSMLRRRMELVGRVCSFIAICMGEALHRAMAQETQFVTNKWRPVLTIEIMRGQIEDP